MGQQRYPNGYRDNLGWQIGFSSYWFATSAKWFILLIAILPSQSRDIIEKEALALAAQAGLSLSPEQAVARFGAGANTAWGMVMAIGAIWAMFGPSLFGYISDRMRVRKPFLAIGAGLTVIALMMLSVAPSIPMMVVGYLLLQISDDVGTGPYSALIPESVPQERRGRASGIMQMLELTAQIFIVVVGMVLGEPKLIYTALAALNVVCAFWVIWILKDVTPLHTPESERTKPKLSEFLRGWVEPWKRPDFFWVWGTRFLGALGLYLIQPYLTNYMEDRVKSFAIGGITITTDPSRAAMYLGLLISLCGATGAIWCAKRADQIGRKKVVVTGGVLMFLMLVPFALVPNYTVIAGLAIVFGFGYGAYQAAGWALASDVMPNPEDLGKDMGVWQMSYSSVQIVAGSAGRLIDMGNRSWGMGAGYTAVFLLAAGVFLLGTVLVRKIHASTG